MNRTFKIKDPKTGKYKLIGQGINTSHHTLSYINGEPIESTYFQIIEKNNSEKRVD